MEHHQHCKILELIFEHYQNNITKKNCSNTLFTAYWDQPRWFGAGALQRCPNGQQKTDYCNYFVNICLRGCRKAHVRLVLSCFHIVPGCDRKWCTISLNIGREWSARELRASFAKPRACSSLDTCQLWFRTQLRGLVNGGHLHSDTSRRCSKYPVSDCISCSSYCTVVSYEHWKIGWYSSSLLLSEENLKLESNPKYWEIHTQ